MASLQRKDAGDRPKRYGGDVRISDDEWVKDEKTLHGALTKNASQAYDTGDPTLGICKFRIQQGL